MNNYKNLQQLLTLTGILLLTPYSLDALAHSAGGPIDAAGNNASATDLAFVTCYDDGNGAPDHLVISINDSSPAVPGLLVSVQIMKDGKMINTTDTISGDGKPSNAVALQGGKGEYYVSVNKTNAGVRNFTIDWHCETANKIHTGTDIGVLQLQ